MPKPFDACTKRGGKVRTVSGPNKNFGLQKGEYLHICVLDGKLFRGYKKRKQDGN